MPVPVTFHRPRAAAVAAALALALGAARADAQLTFSAAGPNAAAIQGQVDAFRAAIGGVNNGNAPGSLGGGRREVNWDGVPAQFRTPNNQPPDFFIGRGVTTTTPGTGVQVSDNAPNPAVFANLNPSYATQFTTFSAPRLFTPVGSNITDVIFSVPGNTTPAFTSAFGVVFVDVDLANATSMQFFDLGGTSLGTFFAPTANAGLSFLGVQYTGGQQIGRVRITTGNTPIGPTEGANVDVVVMDDFIYAEPATVVPEPSTWALLATGLGALVLVRRRVGRAAA